MLAEHDSHDVDDIVPDLGRLGPVLDRGQGVLERTADQVRPSGVAPMATARVVRFVVQASSAAEESLYSGSAVTARTPPLR